LLLLLECRILIVVFISYMSSDQQQTLLQSNPFNASGTCSVTLSLSPDRSYLSLLALLFNLRRQWREYTTILSIRKGAVEEERMMELELLATIQRKALGASAREEGRGRREASVAVLLLHTTSRTTTLSPCHRYPCTTTPTLAPTLTLRLSRWMKPKIQT